MIKNYTLTVCLSVFILLGFSTKTLAQRNKALKQVNLSIQMSDKDSCAIDTIRIFSWTGIQVEEIAKVSGTKGKNGYEFNFSLKNVPYGNYYLGRIVNNSMTDMRPIVLGLEDKILLQGNCSAINLLKFVDSKINNTFESMVDSIKEQSNQFLGLINEFQQNTGNKEKQATIKKAISDLDFRRKELYNNLKKEQPDLSKIVALYTYLSYQNHQKDAQQTEGQYIAENYFQFVNLSDSAYLHIAFFYESFKSYAASLTQAGLTQEQVQAYLDQTLVKVGNKNPQYKPALLAAAFGVMANNKKLFLYYSEQFLKLYRGQNQVLDNFLDQQISQLKSSTEIGDEAPDFTAATPEGGTKSLKSLRGKVLLVDFWASWCGPCRRENPNVVAVYNKYKDKGFDVLGVSLDQDATRWKGAIEQDKLSWHHVSDLGGWGSAPAKLYKVTGIPQTLLLDKNGVIIAKNLRGPALEEKLKEIFGE